MLFRTDWSVFTSNLADIDSVQRTFQEIITNIVHVHVPKKTFKIRLNDKPWMTPTIRTQVRKTAHLSITQPTNSPAQ